VSYTDADLTAVRTALLKGERTVQFADRSVTYRSVDELLQVEARILGELTSTQTRAKQTFGVASKGF
jgi:hypothetical protein